MEIFHDVTRHFAHDDGSRGVSGLQQNVTVRGSLVSRHQKSTLIAPWTAGSLLGRPADGPGGVGEDPAGPAGLALDGDGLVVTVSVK